MNSFSEKLAYLLAIHAFKSPIAQPHTHEGFFRFMQGFTGITEGWDEALLSRSFVQYAQLFAQSAAAADEEHLPDVSADSAIRLLIAENDEVMRLLWKKITEKMGLETDFVEDGGKVLSRVRKSDHDLLLLDLDMPETDSYAAARAVRTWGGKKGRRLPIFALTADELSWVAAKAGAFGIDRCFRKSGCTSQFWLMLREALDCCAR